eukprot:2730173-Ditylum_brightwellii.AAC.1
MEAEYIALSHSMRELLPACWLMDELAQALKLKRELLSMVSTVWEDNDRALILANSPMPHMTPCSKHIGVKYHWFHLWIDGLTVVVKPIESAFQKADILTKPLSRLDFAVKQKMLMGW